MNEQFLWVAVFIVLGASIGLLLVRDWRISLAILSFQYVGMFLLVNSHWPLGMSTAKLITGWMAAAILGMTQSGSPNFPHQEGSWPEGRAFRLFIAALVIIAVASFAPSLLTWLPGISLPVAYGGLILIGMGLLELGITVQPLRVTIGLLTVLCGFEILYASIENSILVAALLSVINLGLALVGAYLINADQSIPQLEEAE
jgi:hypothetical protein